MTKNSLKIYISTSLCWVVREKIHDVYNTMTGCERIISGKSKNKDMDKYYIIFITTAIKLYE